MKSRHAGLVVAFMLVLGGCGDRAATPEENAAPVAFAQVDARSLADEDNGADWASYGRTYSENHYSPLEEINAGTIGRLGLAWAQDLDVTLRADSQPLAAGGVLYVAAGLSIVQAFDATTGKRLWPGRTEGREPVQAVAVVGHTRPRVVARQGLCRYTGRPAHRA
jgi:glucose dehydrogenase